MLDGVCYLGPIDPLSQSLTQITPRAQPNPTRDSLAQSMTQSRLSAKRVTFNAQIFSYPRISPGKPMALLANAYSNNSHSLSLSLSQHPNITFQECRNNFFKELQINSVRLGLGRYVLHESYVSVLSPFLFLHRAFPNPRC